jgi:hypothetical protein
MSDVPPPGRPSDGAGPDEPPPYETHAPRMGPPGHRPPTPEETHAGVRAALVLFVPLVAFVIGASAWLGRGNDVGAMLGLYCFVVVGVPVAAMVRSSLLPRPSRPAYWTAVGICVAAGLLLWGVTCAALIALPAHN